MTERERLIGLLCKVTCDGEESFFNCPERRHGQCQSIQKLEMSQINTLADHLLANGVIVAPMPMAEWLRKELTDHVYKRCMEEL